MPKGTATCNNVVNLYYRAEAIANIADNAAAAPIVNVKMRMATASYVASDNGSANEATYTNYAAQDVARSAAGWTAAAAGATSNVAAIEFPQCGASGNTLTSAASSKGAGASDIFHYGDLNASIAVSNQIQPRFPIGAVTITEA
jgi:hypothetical protein